MFCSTSAKPVFSSVAAIAHGKEDGGSHVCDTRCAGSATAYEPAALRCLSVMTRAVGGKPLAKGGQRGDVDTECAFAEPPRRFMSAVQRPVWFSRRQRLWQ